MGDAEVTELAPAPELMKEGEKGLMLSDMTCDIQ